MTDSPQPRAKRIVGASAVALAAAIGSGCQLDVDPFTDELTHRPVVTTPSAEAARAAHVEYAAPRRSFPPARVHAKDGTVTHGVLYFDDPFEVTGSDDGRFAWNKEDFLYLLHGPARFMANIVFFPIHAAKNPPWLLMASDGRQTVRATEDSGHHTNPGVEHDPTDDAPAS